MAAIYSLTLYFIIVSMMTTISFIVNRYKFETTNINKPIDNYKRILNACRRMPGRSLLEVSDINEENSVKWPDLLRENSENMIKFHKTTVDNNTQSTDIATPVNNRYDIISHNRPSSLSYTDEQASSSPIHKRVSMASMDKRKSWIPKNKKISGTKQIKPMFEKQQIGCLFNSKWIPSPPRGPPDTRLRRIYLYGVTPLATGAMWNKTRKQKVFESATKGKNLNDKMYIIFDKNGNSQFIVKSALPILLQKATHATVGRKMKQYNTV